MDKLIGIPTFKRAASLAKLLDSLVENLPPEGYAVMVVDNDPEKSAEQIVKAYKGVLQIFYAVEPLPGVVHVRNRILEKAQDYSTLIFLDDDEWIGPSWGEAFEKVAKQYPNAILAGPVRYVLPPGTPKFIEQGEFYARTEHMDGQQIELTGTGNSFIPKNVLELLRNEGFDPAFSRIGGEDTELFGRLKRQNVEIRWAANAVVFETVPRSKANLHSITRRYRRSGLVNGVLDSAAKGLGYRIVLTALRVAVGASKYFYRRLTGMPIRARDISTLYSGLGHLDAIMNRTRNYYGDEE